MKYTIYYYFYKTNHPFSQWYPCEFRIDNVDYNCAEQWMMYSKAILFNDFDIANEILLNKDPRKQKEMGRRVNGFNEKIWNVHAKEIVYKGNKAKFTQNFKLLKKLLSTKDCLLVETSPTDNIWGIGLGENSPDIFDRTKWKGLNLLGEILTKLRDDLMEGG